MSKYQSVPVTIIPVIIIIPALDISIFWGIIYTIDFYKNLIIVFTLKL